MSKADDRSPSVIAAYEQGRTAARNAISKEDAPWDKSSDEYREWLRGFNFENKAADEVIAVTSSEGGHKAPTKAQGGPRPKKNANERPKAVGQVSTTSGAKKA